MPSVGVAMARSLEPTAWEKVAHSMARSIAGHLESRNIIGDVSDKVTDIKTALSSWDNCMAANFCKYPVIAIIVVGSLILLSIVYCIARCCCLGKACCCSCCNCLKCCGNCCGCCDSPDSRKNNKYLDEQFAPQDQGYRTQPPMQPFAPVVGTTAPPQYAEFDVSKHNEDSLPQMPSWEASQSTKVPKEQDSMEMSTLNATSMAGGASSVSGRPGQQMDNYGPGYSKPQNPYDSRDAYDMDHGYDMPPAIGAGVGRNSPGPNGYRNQNSNSPYNEMPAESYGPPSSYGPLNNSYGQQQNSYGQQQNSYRGVPTPAPMRQDTYNSIRTGSPGPNYGGYGNAGYGNRGQTNSPAPYGGSPQMRNSPGPQRSPVMHTGEFGGQQTYSPTRENFGGPIHAPQPQHTQPPRALASQDSFHQRQPSSPIVNNSGFDFNSGYTRPPSVDQQGGGGYPGYKPYRG